jgi:LysR family transcriptional regulator, hydrogen peroxide-inducible genes activator
MTSITQLEYVIAVERLRHFGKAAKACHISQPTLSMQIQKMEEALGVIIFDRDKKPVLPTEKGTAVIEQAKAVLREYEKLLGISKTEAGVVRGSFKLGVIPTLAPYLLPMFLEKFSKAFPRVDLVIDEMKTEEIIKGLREDQIDAGLLVTPLHEKGLRERVLFYEPFYVYASTSHPLSARPTVVEADLDSTDIWLLKDGHCFRDQVINYCSLRSEQNSAATNVKFEGGNFETLRNLIRAGRGYTLFPHLFVRGLTAAEKEKHVRKFKQPVPSREVSLVHRRDQWKTDILEALRETIARNVPDDLTSLQKAKTERVEI